MLPGSCHLRVNLIIRFSEVTSARSDAQLHNKCDQVERSKDELRAVLETPIWYFHQN